MNSQHSVPRRSALHVAARPRIRDRAIARVRARQLDRALAAGAEAEASPALAVRARRLTALPRRRVIAATYRRILTGTPDGPARRGAAARVMPSSARVAVASDELARLADGLAQPGPIAARGAAEALLLLSEVTGPLHNPASPTSLRACAAQATAHLALVQSW